MTDIDNAANLYIVLWVTTLIKQFTTVVAN